MTQDTASGMHHSQSECIFAIRRSDTPNNARYRYVKTDITKNKVYKLVYKTVDNRRKTGYNKYIKSLEV